MAEKETCAAICSIKNQNHKIIQKLYPFIIENFAAVYYYISIYLIHNLRRRL